MGEMNNHTVPYDAMGYAPHTLEVTAVEESQERRERGRNPNRDQGS